MDPSVRAAVEAWVSDPAISEEDKREVRDLLAGRDETQLTDRFYRTLEFGTGGMRGVIGAGLNRMNVYTVGAVAQGLANYISRQGAGAKLAGVAIAYDCRRMSDVFARRTACVMAANGITAHLFEQLRPTPELSFAIRHLGCTAGVVITASHNPPQDNGVKAYWSDGVQVIPPHDERIIEEVRKVGAFANVKVMDEGQARSSGLVRLIGREMDERFLEAVHASCLNPDDCRRHGKTLKIVYTNLHGTGGTLIPEALRRRGFENVIEVPEQAEPDGEFPTVASPNPEEGAALSLGIALARKAGADLVIGTDPDGDRVGAAARRPDGGFELITGNQMAALLTYHICEQLTRQGCFPKNAVLVTTIVSGDMMKDVARSYGVEVVETLTGFKWIGQKVSQFEAEGGPGRPRRTYIFGAEESYGYMPAVYTRDKDAVTSTAYIADAAAAAAAEGRGLYDLLQEMFRRFGYYQEGTRNITLPGQEGGEKIKAMMAALRSDPPARIGSIPVSMVGDVTTGRIRDVSTGAVVGRYDLPTSDVLVFTLQDGTKVVARPSGTEPKIKFYVLTREPGDDLAKARADASAKTAAIMADVVRRAS